VGHALPLHLGLGPGLERPQRAQVVGAEGPRPQRGRGRLGPGRPDLAVAGHRPRLQQGLELPRLGPALPVGLVARHRAGEGAVAALGPQVGVDPVAAAGDVHDGPRRPGVAADEHQVDVAGVVELPPAQLPHADDGQAGGADQRHGPVEHGGGDVGQRRGRLLEAAPPEQVDRHDPQVGQPLGPRERLDVGRLGEERQAAVGRPALGVVEVGQHVEGGGIGLDQPRRAAAGGHDGHEGLGQRARRLDPGDDVVAQPAERRPHRVGVRSAVHELGQLHGTRLTPPSRPRRHAAVPWRAVARIRIALCQSNTTVAAQPAERGPHRVGVRAAVHEFGQLHGTSLPPPSRPRRHPAVPWRAVARIRVALCQINTTVGDLDGNVERVLRAAREAEEAGCDLAVFPELALTGYPPEDLLLKPGFVADNRRALDRVAAATGECAVVVGFVDAGRDLYNAAAVCARGRVHAVYHKRNLPNYAVFDEQRYFAPGQTTSPLVEVAGVRVGVSVCEDAFNPSGPIATQADGGAELVVNINASPYYANRL